VANVLISKKEVAQDVFLITGNNPFGLGVNSAVIASGSEAFVVDSLFYPDESRKLIKLLEDEKRRLAGLMNTHWHLDHVAGNELFKTRIISHSLTPQLMRTSLSQQVQQFKNAIGNVSVQTPSEVFHSSKEIEFGDKKMRFIHSPGHTPDSAVVYMPRERVLIGGDTVMELPLITYGDSAAQIRSLVELEKLDASIIIQGHGRICARGKLSQDIAYLENARKIAKEFYENEKTVEELLQSPIDLYFPQSRLDELHQHYKEDIHKENLSKIYQELSLGSQK
jgi:glyoxylase-like metal-dependent hydrolase (beta-lactamase superfamily II)